MGNAGNSDDITRDYLDSMLLETRYVGTEVANTEITLYGEKFDTPIMTAALSHLHNICDNAMAEYALGAKEAGAMHWLGMGDDEELPGITATGAKTVKVIKPHKDDAAIIEKMDNAQAAGCFAMGMDIDHAVSGVGGYDNIFGLEMRPKTVEQLREYTKMAADRGCPFIIKGVLSAYDAEKCVEAGVSGIVVSHHHGIMPYSVPPLMVMPEIVRAIDGQMPIFVDCGIVSGVDVFKALAMGATAVSVGRELMGPLKDGGKAVAARIIEMNNELKGIMARTGATSLDEIDPSVIHFRKF